MDRSKIVMDKTLNTIQVWKNRRISKEKGKVPNWCRITI